MKRELGGLWDGFGREAPTRPFWRRLGPEKDRFRVAMKPQLGRFWGRLKPKNDRVRDSC